MQKVCFKTKIPSFIILRSIIITTTLLSLTALPFAIGKELDRDAIIFLSLMYIMTILLTSFQIFINKGYRISYDEDAVYQRPDGVTWTIKYRPENIMRYEDIEIAYGERGRANVLPFEFVQLCRKGWNGTELFMISRTFLAEQDVREMIQVIYQKVPSVVSSEIIDYLNDETI